MSDEPGTYDPVVLEDRLKEYLVKGKVTSQRIRKVFLPALLKKKTLSREQLKKEFLEHDKIIDASKIGYHLTTISVQLGMKKNDFLRQVVAYEYSTYAWEKDNFALREDYRDFVKGMLEGLKKE